jgi:hypothetical protein
VSPHVVAEPVVRRGDFVPDLEPEFVACGGTVSKGDSDHHKSRYPGLPTVGVPCNRTVVLRKLRSMVCRVIAGDVLAPPRPAGEATDEGPTLQAIAAAAATARRLARFHGCVVTSAGRKYHDPDGCSSFYQCSQISPVTTLRVQRESPQTGEQEWGTRTRCKVCNPPLITDDDAVRGA